MKLIARRLDVLLLAAALVTSSLWICERCRHPLKDQARVIAAPDDYVQRHRLGKTDSEILETKH